MALSANNPRKYMLGEFNDLPVKASSKIYEGSFVGVTGGYARALVAGDSFGGVAESASDNSSGANGDINVYVRRSGRMVINISGLAVTDIGKPVYASDDGTLTLTATNNTLVGRVDLWTKADYGVMAFDADRASFGLVAPLTDNTTGTADGIVADVGGAFSQATLNNNFKELTVKINLLAQQIA